MSGPQLALFGGKGGVGKTTCAASWAIRRAESGERVLLVSTDPAHSLGDALEVKLSSRARRVKARRGELWALELDADAALGRWLTENRRLLREIATAGTYLDDADVDELLKLSLPGVDELMGLLELSRLATDDWDTVVVDSAPTGHTLRLLQTPQTLRAIAEALDDMQEKHRVIAESLSRSYRREPADDFIEDLDARGEQLAEWLRDAHRTSVHWVALAEPVVVAETARALETLTGFGLTVTELLLNRLTPPPPGSCALCEPRRQEEAKALARLRKLGPPTREVLATDVPPRGVDALRRLGTHQPTRAKTARQAQARSPHPAASFRLFEDIPWPKGLRLLCFGGKGGVGKTTCAAASALELAHARPDRRVLLLSTDPAPSIRDVLGTVDLPKNLEARELDAAAEFARRKATYREAVSELFDALRSGSRFDAAYDRRVIEDLVELAPPGIDELFGLSSVMDALIPVWSGSKAAPFDTVVLDTAPTGHALRLLELPEKALGWVHALLSLLLKYKDVLSPGRLSRDLLETAHSLKAVRALLMDGARTRFVVVTRAEELPREETKRMVKALRAMRVPLGAVVVNALTPRDELSLCRRCHAQAMRESAEVRALVRAVSPKRSVALPTLLAARVSPAPSGPKALRPWLQSWARLSTP